MRLVIPAKAGTYWMRIVIPAKAGSYWRIALSAQAPPTPLRPTPTPLPAPFTRAPTR